MKPAQGNYLGLVELIDYDYLIDHYGPVSAQQIRDEFSSRLDQWLRSSDQCRQLRDNRYLVLLSGVSATIELELAAAKLERLFKAPYDLLGEMVPLHIHAGFTLLPAGSKDLKSGSQQARMALREAKKQSTLYQVFDSKVQEQLQDETQLLSSLEIAIQEGQFQLYYQPKIHNKFGNLVGAEALIRWHTKDKQVLTPRHFMDFAERHPVIKPITLWVIKTAIAQLAKWPSSMSIAVNAPPSLLLDNDTLTVIQDMLDIQGVKASRLTLEVTENIMVSNPEQMLHQLTKLRELGVRISIDDFGTGYSSLSYFRHLPADELKIDKTFVTPMLQSLKDQAIVKSTIDLAHNFSLKVVAEGVEDEATAAKLTELGCDVMQGYYFDPPLPIEEFEKRHPI